MAHVRTFCVGIAVVVATFLPIGSASAQTIRAVATFDDLDPPKGEFVLPTRDPFDYKNLRWKGVYLVNSAHPLAEKFSSSGYRTGVVSGEYVAVVAGRKYVESEILAPRHTLLDIESVSLTAVWRNGLSAVVEGLRGEEVVSSQTLTLDPSKPQHVALGFEGVDRLRIRSSGGEDAPVCPPGLCNPGPEIALDDLAFTLRKAESPSTATAVAEEPEIEVQPKPSRPAPVVPVVAEAKPAAQRAAAASKTQAGSPAGDQEPKPCAQGSSWAVQVGAFKSAENAEQLGQELAVRYGQTHVYENPSRGVTLYRVVVGCTEDPGEAKALLDALRARDYGGVVIHVEPEELGSLRR